MTNLIDTFGPKIWYNDKRQIHREDGPAIITEHSKSWLINGKRHRTDGPAVEWSGLSAIHYAHLWFVDNKLIDINPILERLEISPDWRSWTEEEKFLVRLALS